MNEIENYQNMLQGLKDKYSHFDEIDNTVADDKWNINDIVICINSNFIKDQPSHGQKDGLSFGKFYKITQTPEMDMIMIENDFYEVVPYFNWRFLKIINQFDFEFYLK